MVKWGVVGLGLRKKLQARGNEVNISLTLFAVFECEILPIFSHVFVSCWNCPLILIPSFQFSPLSNPIKSKSRNVQNLKVVGSLPSSWGKKISKLSQLIWTKDWKKTKKSKSNGSLFFGNMYLMAWKVQFKVYTYRHPSRGKATLDGCDRISWITNDTLMRLIIRCFWIHKMPYSLKLLFILTILIPWHMV